MNIRFENMREPVRLRGMSTSRPANGAGTRADSLPLFVPQSILPDASLPFRQLSQAPLHKSELLINVFCVALGGVGAIVAGCILLFVHIPSPF